MDEVERAQIRLILEHLTADVASRSAGRQQAMYADHASKGLLRSGNTVKASLQIVEDLAREYVIKAVDQVATIAQDTDAFALILASLTARFRTH